MLVHNAYKALLSGSVGTRYYTWDLGSDGLPSVFVDSVLAGALYKCTELTIVQMPNYQPLGQDSQVFMLIEPRVGAVLWCGAATEMVTDPWRVLRDEEQEAGPGGGNWGENEKILF